MAATRHPANNDLRRQVGSPRSKGRGRFPPAPLLASPASNRPTGAENNKDTVCRNILIYGNCRYEDQGCTFNHDQNKNSSTQAEP